MIHMLFLFGCLSVSPAAGLPLLSMGCCILLAWTMSLGLPGPCVGPLSTPQRWTHFGTANTMFHRKLSSLDRTGLESRQQEITFRALPSG